MVAQSNERYGFMALMWYEMSSFLLQEQAAEEILHSNRHSLPFGLQLTKQQALELAETRSRALHACGRVEFGAGMIGKLAEAFCSSPYLSRETYAETLNELVELFYLYKSETGERVTDDGLIRYMRAAFDGPCGGSLELLGGRALYRLAHRLRSGACEEDQDV